MSQNEKDQILGFELDEDQLKQVSGGDISDWDGDSKNCTENHYWPLEPGKPCSATVQRDSNGKPTGMCGTNDRCNINAIIYRRVPGSNCAATVESGSDCWATDACSNNDVRYWDCYMADL